MNDINATKALQELIALGEQLDNCFEIGLQMSVQTQLLDIVKDVSCYKVAKNGKNCPLNSTAIELATYLLIAAEKLTCKLGPKP